MTTSTKTHFGHLVFTLSLLVGCQRNVCEFSGRAPSSGKSNAFWDAHKDVFAPGVKVCEATSPPTYESVEADFTTEPQTPMVTISQDLESKGWTRTRQEVHAGIGFDVAFAKGDQTLTVNGLTSHGRTQLHYVWPKNKK